MDLQYKFHTFYGLSGYFVKPIQFIHIRIVHFSLFANAEMTAARKQPGTVRCRAQFVKKELFRTAKNLSDFRFTGLGLSEVP